MVGVAGKSRACHDCKRRRVKCDFRKPSCLRCEKARLPCRGYDKPSTFVNRTVTQPFTTALSVISEARSHRMIPIPKPASSLSQVFQWLRKSISDPSSSPLEFRSQAWELLRDLYLPQTQVTSDPDLRITTPYSWLHAVCQLNLKSNILDLSLLAFCAIQIHIAEPLTISVDLALQLYSEALPELIQNLGRTHEQSKDETLAAIVVLSTCELFVLPNDQGWRAHAHGISELLRHRTSFDDRSTVWLKLCSRLRVICVILGLTKRRRLALGSNMWRQIMHVDSGVESFESLMDLVSEVPLLLEESDDVVRSGASYPQLLRNLLEVFRKISDWQKSYRLSTARPLYWAVPSRLHNSSDDGFSNRLFPFAFQFESLNVAIQIIFSSAVMLQLLSAVLILKGGVGGSCEELLRQDTTEVDNSDAEKNLWSVPSMKQNADRLARFLCQSIEYCFRHEMGTLGPQATCHPQWAMKDYFRHVGLERELAWCENIKNMDGPGMRPGIDLMIFGSEETYSSASW